MSSWKCPSCRNRSVAPATLPYATELEYDGQLYAIQLPELQVQRCGSCGEIILDVEANRKLSEALRREAGILTPTEIRRQREAPESCDADIGHGIRDHLADGLSAGH